MPRLVLGHAAHPPIVGWQRRARAFPRSPANQKEGKVPRKAIKKAVARRKVKRAVAKRALKKRAAKRAVARRALKKRALKRALVRRAILARALEGGMGQQ